MAVVAVVAAGQGIKLNNANEFPALGYSVSSWTSFTKNISFICMLYTDNAKNCVGGWENIHIKTITGWIRTHGVVVSMCLVWGSDSSDICVRLRVSSAVTCEMN